MATEAVPKKKLSAVEELDAKFAELSAIMDRIPKALMEAFGGAPEDETPQTPLLKSFDLSGAIKYMKNCSKIIIMCGAGISTSAGIPDFRTPGTGLYSQLEKYNLPSPESIFALDYFRENPKPFFSLAKELCPNKFKPTPTHHFMRLLNDKGKLLRIFTQNIDSLERVAHIPAERVVEAHGTFFTAHCLDCQKGYTLDQIKETFFKDEIPLCSDCSGIVKPDIVFFGENLPKEFHERCNKDFPECDFLIIMGTSLKVAPFNSLISRVNNNCPRLLINMEPAGDVTDGWNLVRNGLKYDSDKNYRDVFHKSTCDEAVSKIAELLGWQNEFDRLLGITRPENAKKTQSVQKVTSTSSVNNNRSTTTTATRRGNEQTSTTRTQEIENQRACTARRNLSRGAVSSRVNTTKSNPQEKK